MLPALALAVRCSTGPHPHDELLELRNSLTPTSTKSEIRRRVESSHSLFLSTSDEPTTWSVGTPLSWNARNWVLWIDFDGDQIRQARIRIYDSATMKPEGAPPDLRFDRAEVGRTPGS